jgi:hypothetical protein
VLGRFHPAAGKTATPKQTSDKKTFAFENKHYVS